MPKEIITSTPADQFAPEVRWGRDRDVQLATVDLSRADDDPERGLFASLDRSGINRLIRVLRRARDQAYGPDA